MSLQQLCGRLIRLEAQRRPWVVADVLRHTRQCASGERGAFLMAALTSVDKTTATAILAQLTEAEVDALIGPEMKAFIETLPESDLELLANGDPVALQRLWRSYQRWRNGRA
jgi:hypothetical protein